MAINAKLLKFQQLNLVIKKDSSNPAFKGSKYASLPEILETVIPKLTELKLVVVNTVQDGTIVTELIDTEDDTKVSANFPLFGTKPQEFGSSITYGRRYNLGALLNLQIDDDDDGNAANNAQRTSSAHSEGSPLLDAINAVKNAEDIDSLKDAYENGKSIATTEKQKKWLNDEVQKRKNILLGN